MASHTFGQDTPAALMARSELLRIVADVAAEQGFYEYEVEDTEAAYGGRDTVEGSNKTTLLVRRSDHGPTLVKMHVTPWHVGPIAVETFNLLKGRLGERFDIKVRE